MPSASPLRDVIIIGAGHNGLCCASYLAQAGRDVLVLEKSDVFGGAVCTREDLIPGYKIDIGSSAHIMIHLTPILRELELARHGLEYIEMDPWGCYPVPGEGKAILFWRDLDKTCESIAQFSPRDAKAYREFVHKWTELNEGIFDSFLEPPSPGRIFAKIFWRNLKNARSRKLWSSLDTVRELMAPYAQLINEYFEHPHVRTALEWLAAQAGPAPTEVASGDLLGWNAMLHRSGAWRAKGGSGSLSKALVSYLREKKGEVRCNAEVLSVERDGSDWRVTCADGSEHRARRVVSAMHVVPFFGKLLRGAPEKLGQRVSNLRIGNGFGMIVRHAVSELPAYTGNPEIDALCHRGLQLLCPDRRHLMSSFIDYQAGLPPKEPSVVAMTFSSLDSTLAPTGKHTMFTWGQWHPYELSNGEKWADIAEREADKLYDLVCQYAPNMRGKMIDRYIQTPEVIEQLFGMVRANVMHLEMSIDQMFFFRPLPELSEYKVPGLPGLYLTGASTHPGGGVFGASGRNTAQVILAEKK